MTTAPASTATKERRDALNAKGAHRQCVDIGQGQQGPLRPSLATVAGAVAPLSSGDFIDKFTHEASSIIAYVLASRHMLACRLLPVAGFSASSPPMCFVHRHGRPRSWHDSPPLRH